MCHRSCCQVKGLVKDVAGCPVFLVKGFWDGYMEHSEVVSQTGAVVETGPAQPAWAAQPLQ